MCYPLSKGETSFGRSAGCDVRIYDSAVSNVHAKLFLPGVGPEHLQALDEEEQEARLVVLSPNNVKVDDKTVRQSESVALKDAAVIDILGRKFQFNVCHQHKQPLLDTPRTSHNSANHKVRQSMVQRAVLETPVRPSLDDYKEQIEEADLMQWSDDEDQVSVQNRRREASNSEESDPDDENSRQQLCISPRTSQPGPVEETSDEEVEHSLLIPASPTPCPPQLPESPSRPQMQHNKSSPSVEAAQAAMMTPKQPVRAQSYPSPTAGSANNNRSGASVQRRKSLLEKVLIKSAVKAASHRRLSQQQQQQKHKSSSDCVSDSEGSSDSDLSDPDDIDDEDNDEVEEKPAPPAPSLQLDHSAQNYSAAEFEQFFVSSSSDGDDDSDSEDHEADVANASVFSSEDDEEGMSESDVAANQTILPQSTKVSI